MAQRHDKEAPHSMVPVLVSPREQDLVDGRRVTFRWEPVPGAASYRLEVASDAQFDQTVVARDVGQSTIFTVADAFSLDDETYYWRVLATDTDGHTHGEDNVESFIAGTEDQAERIHHAPGQEENLGPVAEMLKGAAVEASAEVTQSDELFEVEAEMGVAHEGVEAGEILGITLGVALALAIIILLLFQYAGRTAQERQFQAVGISGYPALRQLDLQADQQLEQYDVVDAQQGVYRIPIERAMDLMVNEARQRPGGNYAPELDLQVE